MEIEEVLGMVQGQIRALRSIRAKYPNDAQLQGMVAGALDNLAEQTIRLTMLYHYKSDKGQPHEHTNGGQP